VRRFGYSRATIRHSSRSLVWAVIVVAVLSALPGRSAVAIAPRSPAGTTFQVDGAARTLTAAEPESLGLRQLRVRGRTVWAEAGVSTAQVEWAVHGGEATASLLPGVAGLPMPQEPVALYLFASGDGFRRATSELIGLPPDTIHNFEGGRSYAAGARRGVYLNTGAISSADQAARLVAHELVHLAERDQIGARAVPRWFSEGLAEHVAQRVMARVDAHSAAERLWRRSAVVASGLHRQTAFPISALTTPAQWSDAAAAGYDRFIYAEALLAVDWLISRGGLDSPARILGEIARDTPFATALERTVGVPLDRLDAQLDAALRADLLARFPVGIHMFAASGASGTRFQFAAVGLPPGEVVSREFVRDDGHPASDSGAPAVVSPSGVAYWTFQTRPDSQPARWWVTIQGDRGTWARIAFDVVSSATAAAEE
jgi:hypothetical protein